MRNPLAAHPPWKQLVIVTVILPLVITAAVLAFAWPSARVAPRDVPVGIVGATPQSQAASASGRRTDAALRARTRKVA